MMWRLEGKRRIFREKCPECGTKRNQKDQIICEKCGTELEVK